MEHAQLNKIVVAQHRGRGGWSIDVAGSKVTSATSLPCLHEITMAYPPRLPMVPRLESRRTLRPQQLGRSSLAFPLAH